MIDVFMISSNMAFACVYMLDSRLTPAAQKMRKKKESKLDFDYFGVILIDYWLTTVIYKDINYGVL